MSIGISFVGFECRNGLGDLCNNNNNNNKNQPSENKQTNPFTIGEHKAFK